MTDGGPLVLVDDNETDSFLVKTCLKMSVLERAWVHCKSGQAFLDYLDRVREGENSMPSHVLLDLSMPGIDGFGVLKRVRSTPEFSRVPMITVLTNSDDPRDKERSFALGADEFVTKPMELRDLVDYFDSLVAA
jgi:CheY-like chemotaxis protein